MSAAKTPDIHTKAVAIKKGRDEKASSASISAKGKGYLAERILDIAFDKGIAVRKDSTLTNILSELEVDSPIPLEAIDAVAEVFRQLYLLDQGLDPAVIMKQNETPLDDQTNHEGNEMKNINSYEETTLDQKPSKGPQRTKRR